MKFLKSISLFCFILILILVSAFWIIFPSMKARTQNVEETEYDEMESSSVVDLTVSTKQNVTTCDTVYEVEAYTGKYYEHSIEELPFSFSGLTREELEEEIKRYEISPSFEDKQKGFQSIELLAFHPERVTVKKVYAIEEEKIVYYLKVIDYELVVYRSDMEEAYMPTDLTLDMLPETVQQEVIAVKCFNHISEVYDFLESYTS